MLGKRRLLGPIRNGSRLFLGAIGVRVDGALVAHAMLLPSSVHTPSNATSQVTYRLADCTNAQLGEMTQPIELQSAFLTSFGKKAWQHQRRTQTLTPLVEVRILVPQPVDLTYFSLFFDENIPERFEGRFEIFIPLSSFRIAFSPRAGSLLR
jgi:hypothetical protein